MAALLIIPATSVADDGEDASGLAHCNPVAFRLAEAMDIECEQLLELLAEGYGLGQVMQAIYVADSEAELEDIEALLQQKEESDIGWGQLKMANRLANDDFDADEMLALKVDEGLGWGQIKKIQALMDANVDKNDAITAIKSDMDWEDIREAFDLDDGPPPWAGGGKDKAKGKNGNGPPPWSNAGGKNQGDEEPPGE
jgi:hypothetical protein